jgi:hypothetical protein
MTIFINNYIIKENGNGIYILDLINKLNLNSVKIISLGYEPINKKFKAFTIKNEIELKNFYLRKIVEFFFMTFLILKNIKELKNETIVLTSNPPMLGFVLILLKKISKFNLIFWCQDIFPNTLIVSDILKSKNIFFYLLRLINKFIYNNVDKIVTISNSMMKTLIKDYRVDSNKIIVIENWNLLNLKKKNIIKNKNIINKHKINIFYNGNISPVHDEKFAIDFIKQIKNKDLYFKIFTNSQYINKRFDEKLFNKSFLNNSSFYRCLLKSDFQMIFSKPNALKYIYPSKTYNILYLKKPIIYFNKNGNDEIVKFLKKYKIGITINNKNKKKFFNLFSDTKKIRFLIKSYKSNFEKLDFLEKKKKVSISKWKDMLKCVE